jgi:TonB family protein
MKVDAIEVTAPQAMKDALMARLTVRQGDPWNEETAARVRETVQQVDEHLRLAVVHRRGGEGVSVVISLDPVTGAVSGGIIGGVIGGVVGGGPTGGMYPQPPPPPPASDGTPRIRVGGMVQQIKLISQIAPTYPPLAKEARVQGMVRLNAVIAKDGTVRDLQILSGHPLLVPAAVEAVKQWRYQTTLLNGNPVEVMTTIDVNFTLSE